MGGEYIHAQLPYNLLPGGCVNICFVITFSLSTILELKSLIQAHRLLSVSDIAGAVELAFTAIQHGLLYFTVSCNTINI